MRWHARRRKRTGQAALVVSVSALLVLGACSSKNGVTDPPPAMPPVQGPAKVEGRVVKWTTDVPTRGSVRYGSSPGNYDHMAYPIAAERRDRELRLDHEVPLLNIQQGELVYYQALNESPEAPRAISVEDTFTASVNGPAELLTSTMIHIGFGDSHLITMPNGTRILTDSGYREASRAVEEFLEQENVNDVDAMVSTHVHLDHIGGLVGEFGRDDDGLLATHSPTNFLDSPVKTSHVRTAYGEALRTAANNGVQVVVVERGQSSLDTPVLNWDPNVRVVVLSSGTWPDYNESGNSGQDINNDSIVLRFSYGDVDFVIGGDAEDFSEFSMVNAFTPAELEVEYYKSHHHGLSDANSGSWINTLRPRVAFIPNTQQVWDPPESFEGAIAEATGRLRAVGAHIYVIDEAEALGRPRGDGRQYNVTFATDGASYEVRIELARQTVPSKAVMSASCMAGDPDIRTHRALAHTVLEEDSR